MLETLIYVALILLKSILHSRKYMHTKGYDYHVRDWIKTPGLLTPNPYIGIGINRNLEICILYPTLSLSWTLSQGLAYPWLITTWIPLKKHHISLSPSLGSKQSSYSETALK